MAWTPRFKIRLGVRVKSELVVAPVHLGTAARSTARAEATPHPLTLVTLLCAATTILIGAAVLLGWFTGNELLMTVVPGHIRMKPNAALSFIAAGAGLACLVFATPLTRRIARVIALLLLAVGSLTLFEYVARVDLRLDQLLFRDPVQVTYPGRMAHITAIDFCLAGLSLLLLTGGPRLRRLAQATTLLLTTVAFAAIVGYLYGVSILYGSAGYSSMAFHTGVAFLLLGTGFLLAPADSVLSRLLTAPERGSWFFRRALPAALLLPCLLGWLYLRPGLSFNSPIFAMALFAVTLTAVGSSMLWLQAILLNREQQQIAENDCLHEQSERLIKQSEHELRLITDHLPTLLSYIDRDGRFLRVNRTYEHWMGLPPGEIVGKTILELLGDAYWTSTLHARARVLRGETVTFEVNYPTIRGERRAQVTYAPDTDEHGSVRGMSCLVLDMHDRYLAESALRQSEKLAAVGRMASSIAHEINNPLEAVTNLLYLAEQEASGILPAAAQYAAQAQIELARVTHIVTQTLRFHRQSTAPAPCRISDLIMEVLVLYQGKLAQAHIAVESRFRNVDPVLCREGEIRQAIANFVGNAADAMASLPDPPPGSSPRRRLLLRTACIHHPHTGLGGVSCTIADTGHGISQATRNRLFEPFHTTKGATGSGLGLWISKEIIERHQGTLHVRTSTRPGHSGTVFRVCLYGGLADLPPA